MEGKEEKEKQKERNVGSEEGGKIKRDVGKKGEEGGRNKKRKWKGGKQERKKERKKDGVILER